MIRSSPLVWGIISALLVWGSALSPGARAEGARDSSVARIYLDDVLPAPDGERTVELSLRAETAKGPAVVRLQASDLEIRDDGNRVSPVRTELRTLSEARLGAASVIVIDASRAMKGEPFARAVEATLSYLDRMEDHDRLAVVTFADAVEVVFDFDVARPEARRRLEHLSADEGSRSTLLFDGLFEAVDLLRDAPELPRRRFAIAFSDGRDNGSTHRLAEVVARAGGGEGEPRVPFYTVGYARFGGAGLETLERLAEGTTARAFEASSPQQLAALFDEIRQQMLDSYVLRYPASMDGGRHTIDVSCDAKQDTRSAVYPELDEPSWPLALGAVLLLGAGLAVLLYQRRRVIMP